MASRPERSTFAGRAVLEFAQFNAGELKRWRERWPGDSIRLTGIEPQEMLEGDWCARAESELRLPSGRRLIRHAYFVKWQGRDFPSLEIREFCLLKAIWLETPEKAAQRGAEMAGAARALIADPLGFNSYERKFGPEKYVADLPTASGSDWTPFFHLCSNGRSEAAIVSYDQASKRVVAMYLNPERVLASEISGDARHPCVR